MEGTAEAVSFELGVFPEDLCHEGGHVSLFGVVQGKEGVFLPTRTETTSVTSHDGPAQKQPPGDVTQMARGTPASSPGSRGHHPSAQSLTLPGLAFLGLTPPRQAIFEVFCLKPPRADRREGESTSKLTLTPLNSAQPSTSAMLHPPHHVPENHPHPTPCCSILLGPFIPKCFRSETKASRNSSALTISSK